VNSLRNCEDCEAGAYIRCMYARGLIPVVPLFVMCIPTAFGQLPKRGEKCLPYPTLAQEIRQMRPADPELPRVRVRVIRVEFDSKDGLPPNSAFNRGTNHAHGLLRNVAAFFVPSELATQYGCTYKLT